MNRSGRNAREQARTRLASALERSLSAFILRLRLRLSLRHGLGLAQNTSPPQKALFISIFEQTDARLSTKTMTEAEN
jgi:hypothetical protein